MRIAHVTATFPPYYTGTGNVCFHNARVLAERGHDVHVYTIPWSGEADDPAGVTVHRIKPILRLGNAPMLPQLCAIDGADIIHLHYPFIFGAEFVTYASRRKQIPLVLTYHNDLIAPGARGRFFSLYERMLTPRILGTACGIYTVSPEQSTSSGVLHRTSSKRRCTIEHIPNGVDTYKFHPNVDGTEVRRRFAIPPEADVVAFIGGLDSAHYFKRVDVLINAVASIADPNVHLLIVGGGDRLEMYRSLAASRNLGSRTHFANWVPHDDLPPYLAASDVLVLPSDSVESFGMVLIEAMACGKSVIATDLPGVRSVVTNGEDGLLIRPTNVDDLRCAIATLIADAPRRTDMGKRGRRKVVEHYSWDRIGAQLEGLYSEVLDRLAVSRVG